MQHILHAHVKNGRLVLDEPTDLPEGEVVSLVVVGDGDDLDDEDRAALDRSLDEAVDEMLTGERVEAEVVVAEIQARRT